MEQFLNLLDLHHVSIWERVHEKHLERGGPLEKKKEKESDWISVWTDYNRRLPIDAKATLVWPLHQ